MPFTTFWSPNQATVAQVETYTFSAPAGIGSTYTATINGKSVTYTSISGDTAATAATGLYALLIVSTIPELGEVTFANVSNAVVTATALVAGTPFANVTVGGVSGQGLVMSTGGGLSNGIATAHTQVNTSPSDVNDAQNWLRVNTGLLVPTKTRALPVNGDNVVVANTTVPMLWNLDLLINVQFATYTRWQNFTGTIGLPENNPNGYAEWRATYFCFSGPQGSVPAGGLTMVLGYNSGSGAGPTRERYNVGSQQATVQALAAGLATDEWGIRFLGVHTANTFTALGGVKLGVAMLPGEVSQLSSCTVDGGSTIGIGAGVAWTAGSTLTVNGGAAIINAAPATLALSNSAQATIAADQLTWATITTQSNCTLTWLAGGIVTSLTMTVSCTLDKSQDARALTITNHTIDGDTCTINDPLNTITFTNAGTVQKQVGQGPYRFTGNRTVKVT
jgi:hypothetical protein